MTNHYRGSDWLGKACQGACWRVNLEVNFWVLQPSSSVVFLSTPRICISFCVLLATFLVFSGCLMPIRTRLHLWPPLSRGSTEPSVRAIAWSISISSQCRYQRTPTYPNKW